MVTYALAQRGKRIELVRGECHSSEVGDTFERMPGKIRERWTIVKTFTLPQHLKLDAFVQLSGFETVSQLFQIDVL